MTKPWLRPTWALVASLAALVASGSVALADDCIAAKAKAGGRGLSSLLLCSSKLAANGDSTKYADCAGKASTKLADALDPLSACAGTFDNCAGTASICEQAIAAAVPAPALDKCAAAKRKAAAKLIKSISTCYAKAAKKDVPVDSDCLTKARTKFDASLIKAGTCDDGGDLAAVVEQACLADLVTLDSGDHVTTACTQVDECALATDNCDANATCTDLDAGFSCACDAGYVGDGLACEALLTCPCWNTETATSLATKFNVAAASPGSYAVECFRGVINHIQVGTPSGRMLARVERDPAYCEGLDVRMNFYGAAPCLAELGEVQSQVSFCP